MTRYLLALVLLVALGCGPSYEIATDIEPPELISYTPLPPFHPLPDNRVLKLSVLLCVKEDGTVEHARMLSSSGDAAWDSLVEKSVLTWRYAPPMRNGVPTDVWVHQQIVVQFEEPILMSLSRISASSQSQADSLYTLLERGADFDALASQFSVRMPEGQSGFLGTVDIRTFAPRVREALANLHEGSYTHPLRSGNSYVIYKRLKNVTS